MPDQQDEPQAPTWFDEWSGRTPVISRYVLYISLGGWLVSTLFGWSMLFANCPMATLMALQLWRLFTAPLTNLSLLSGVITTVVFVMMGPKRERAIGSTAFLLQVLLFTWGTQMLYAVLHLVVAWNPIMVITLGPCSAGISTIWLGILSAECASNPEGERKLVCVPVKNKWFPWILLGVFALLFGLRMDSLAAVLLGHLVSWGYLPFASETATDTLAGLEAGRFASLTSLPGYVLTENAGAPAPAPGADPEAGRNGGWVSRNGGDVFGRGRGNNAGAGGAAGAGGSGTSGTPQGAFSGSGHSLGGGGGGGGGFSLASLTGGGATPGPTGGEGGKDAAAAIRAARVAALERRLAAGSAGGAAATSTTTTPPGPAQDLSFQLMQLTELGFDREAAQRALQQTDGDVDRAAMLLSAT